MQTTTEKLAIDYARELAGALGDGWTLDSNTLRAIGEEDQGYTRHWAGLETPQHPGAELGINTSHREQRLSVSVTYPKDWEPRIDGQRVHRHSITVSLTKTPEQIARDVKRRLFEATGYLPRVAECLAARDAANARQRHAADITRHLAELAGAQTESDRARQWGPGAAHRVTEQNDCQFQAWPNTSGSRLECIVSSYQATVDLKIHDIAPAFAEEVIKAWRAYLATVPKREESA